MAHRRSLGFPGFPVEIFGFGRLRVVLLERTTSGVAGESSAAGNPGTLGMTKRRGLLKGKDRCREIGQLLGAGRLLHQQQPLLCESKRSLVLRMTVF
jgi:hypothetical protein